MFTGRLFRLLFSSIFVAAVLCTATASPVSAAPGPQPAIAAGDAWVPDFQPLAGGFHSDGFSLEVPAYSGRLSVRERLLAGASDAGFGSGFPFGTPDNESATNITQASNAAGDTAVVWESTSYPTSTLLLSVRRANSSTWSTPTAVAPDAELVGQSNAYAALSVQLVVTDQGRIVVAWGSIMRADNLSDSTHELWVSRGTIAADGADMSTPESIEQLTGNYAFSVYPEAIAARPDGAVFLVSKTSETAFTTTRKLWLHRLDAGSTTWTTRVRLDSEDPAAGGAADQDRGFALAFGPDGDGLAAWGTTDASDSVIGIRSIDTAENINATIGFLGGLWAQSPAIDYDQDGDLTVAWVEQANATGTPTFGVKAFVEPANGAASTNQWVSTTFGGGVFTPLLAHDGLGGRTYVAWMLQPENQSITRAWLAERGRGEDVFAPEVNVSDDDSYVSNLALFADDGGDAALAWANAYSIEVAPVDRTGPSLDAFTVPASTTAGASVSFSVAASDLWSVVPDANVVWTIDGVQVGTGRVLGNRSFASAGTYSIVVTATDAAGNARSRSTSITVGPAVDTGGGGSTGGGTGGGGSTKVDDTTPKPIPFQLTDTTSRDKVPNVVGLLASTARDRFDRAGIEADFEIRMINRPTAPKGISIGEVIAQTPAPGTMVTSAIRDAEPVRLDVYAGPAVGKPTKAGCSVTRVSAAVKGLDLDLAKLVLKSMKCAYQVDVTPAKTGDDATVTGAKVTKGSIHLGVSIPSKPSRNDMRMNFRENPTGISFERGDWTLTAGQANSFTFQAVDLGFRLAVNANVYIDMSGVGAAKNIVGHTDANGETSMVLTPMKAGTIDVLVELPGADNQSIWGYAQLKVVDRSSAKVGTRIATVAGRVFQKNAYGSWSLVPGGTLAAGKQRARFLGLDGLLSAMQQLVAPLGNAIRDAFAAKPVNPEQTLSAAFAKTKVSPAQLNLTNPLIGGNLGVGTVQPGQVVAAGGGNVVAAGGGNVIAAGGGNVVAAGGGNVVASGGGNVIAAGGGNLLTAAAAGVIAAGGGNVIAAGGGNVIAAGGGNVIAAGGGNVIAAGGGN